MEIKEFFSGIGKKFKQHIRIISTICSKDNLIFSNNNTVDRYEDLAPEDISDFELEYFTALDWAFNNKKVRNIAIAGPYGSGKSSIINSYAKKHPELRCINISLADFLSYDKDGKEIEGDFSETELEIGILKQLFYKVSQNKIPQSRYRKLHTVSRVTILGALLLGGILAGGISAFVYSDIRSFLNDLIIRASNNFKCSEENTKLIAIIIILVGLFLLMELIWFVLSKIHVKEINIADMTTATTEKGMDESIFNKNMDEIVYFFEATKYNVVFIEDLDRFNSTSIFIKLRELNTILNNYEKIKKRIVFVYAIRDDMFTHDDRTKFFEFILPVVPIINATNSGEVLSKRIKRDKQKYGDIDIDEEFIDMVSPFISDRRVLDNLYNEFITYKKTLQGKSTLNSEKLNLKDQLMLSLIIFKNLYPREFADLQSEKGIVKEAFQGKRDFLENKRKELEKQKVEIIKKIELAESDGLRDSKEIKMAMMYQMTQEAGMFRYINVGSHVYSFQDILEDDFDINNLIKNGTVSYWRNYNNDTSCNFNGKNFFKDNNYIERLDYISAKIPEIKDDYTKKIEELENESHRLGAMSLKELVNNYGISDVLPQAVQQNKLLIFMLRNGFIDEKYPNYINYFHENSITRDDMNFILSVRNHESMEFTYSLSQIAQVIKKLRPFEFEQKEVYNFALLDALLEDDTYIEKRNLFFKQLGDESEQSWKFINEYFDKALRPDKFIATLSRSWKNMWNYIYNNQILTEERKDKYLKYICAEAELQDIIVQNNADNLKKYFVDRKDILKCLFGIPSNRIIGIIKECNIVFSDLDINIGNAEVLEWIFDNGYYKMNIEMLHCIFKLKHYGAEIDFVERNYTAIMELGYVPLIEKIDEDISNYVSQVFLKLDANTKETIETVLYIIGKINDIEQACKIIQKEEAILDDLDKADTDKLKYDFDKIGVLWDEWIVEKKLRTDWNNLIRYWKKMGVTNSLLEFIENGIEKLETIECPIDIDPALIDEIIQSELDEIPFERFMKCVPKIERNIKLKSVNTGHMRILILMKYFEFSKAFAEELKMMHPELYVLGLITNYETVLGSPNGYSISIEEVEQIVRSEALHDQEKILFISLKITDVYTPNIAMYLRSVNLRLDKTVYWKAWAALEEEEKYELFIKQIGILNNDDISKCFMELGNDYKNFSDRSSRHDEKLFDNEYNRRLVEHLKKVSYITSYEADSREIWDEQLHRRRKEPLIRCRIKKEI